MILVTGATGNIGGALLTQLHASGATGVRGLTRDPGRAAFPSSVTVFEGDLTRPESLKPALEGIRSLLLVPGPGGERAVLDLARDAGVGHVVLISSLAVQSHPHLPASQENLALEEYLKSSGIAWTILRPTQFSSNALWWSEWIRELGAVSAPYGDIGLPSVHPADIAAVAHAALTGPGHHGQTYPLTGPERITPREQLAAIATAVGRDLTFQEIDREQAHAQMAQFMGDATAAAVLDLMGGDINDEILRVHDTVPRITGSPGRTFAQWAGENVTAFADTR